MDLMDGYDINQTSFPTLNNQNVAKTVTSFNYNVWGAKTRLYLKHIPAILSSDYKHVVKFANKTERDKYFKENDPIILDTEFRIPHDGKMRLPIPYDNLINYNYIVASYPDAPVPNYDSNNARKDYYYFIENCEFVAPNTTEVTITLDIWTTYIDEITISNMNLKRGHYPMTLTDVDSYLANPLQNRIGIGTMDVNYGELCQIGKYHKYNLLYGSTEYIVIATTSFPPLFTDTVSTYNGMSIMEAGVFYFAIKKDDFLTWIDNTRTNTPAFFQTILGVMIINSNYVAIGDTTINFNGVTCYTSIGGKMDAIDYTFDKSDFNYDEKYQWITKLYTYPYAAVEYIDQNGNSNLIKYEDLYVGKFSLSIFTRLCVNNHKSKAIIMNVGGEGLQGEFNMHTFEIPIPSSIINQDPNSAYMFETKYPREQQKNDYTLAYDTGLRSANTGKLNTDSSAVTAKTSADASADLSSTISSRNNSLAKDLTTKDINCTVNVTNNNIALNKDVADAQLEMDAENQWLADMMQESSAIFQTASNMIHTTMQAANIGANAAMTVATGGAVPGGSILGIANIMGQQAWDASTREAQWNVYKAISEEKARYYPSANAYINGSNGLKYKYSTNPTDYEGLPLWPFDNYTLQAINVDQDIDTQDGIINANTKKNMQLQKENSEYHRDQNYDIAEQNRTDSLNVSKDNNTRSYEQTIANNQRSYQTTIDNLGDVKANSEIAIQNAINQSRYNNNRSYGSPNDVDVFDYHRNIIQYHIKTQSNDAISRAGDQFLRYGYNYEGNVDFNNFNIMDHFTYWETEDVWLYGDTVNNSVINTIKAILQNGVTVWSNPNEVGKINIYNNKIRKEV